MYKTAFYYSQLPSTKHKELYLKVLKCIRERKTVAVIEDAEDLGSDDMQQILYALDYDYPELFYVQLFGDGCYSTFSNKGKREFHFRYYFPSAEQELKIQETKKFISYILSLIPQEIKTSKYKTVLYIHDILCRNLVYDHEANEKGALQMPEAYSIVGGMRSKTAVCSGISKLFQMLCEQEDIWCTYVAGITHLTEEEQKNNVEGSTGRHAWNLICINNIYAHIDTTWDLKEGKNHIPHTYFGMGSGELFRTRSPDQRFSNIHLPECIDKNPLNYYIYNNVYFRSFAELEKYVASCVLRKERELSFRIDPQGFDHLDISKRTQKFMSNYMKKKAHDVKQWKWQHNDTMMTFEYSLEYS